MVFIIAIRVILAFTLNIYISGYCLLLNKNSVKEKHTLFCITYIQSYLKEVKHL